jgi:hypothetical protein
MSRNKDKTYSVYFHTNIGNNKVYVGVTSQTIVNRWGKNGSMYLMGLYSADNRGTFL